MGHGLPAGTVEWARAAERAGFGSVWIIEDYFHPGAFALAGAAAVATERIGIGLGVVNPYTRHPALLAMETAALAGLAPGRIALGLGSSNRRWIEEQMDDPVQDAAARPARERRDRPPAPRRRARSRSPARSSRCATSRSRRRRPRRSRSCSA